MSVWLMLVFPSSWWILPNVTSFFQGLGVTRDSAPPTLIHVSSLHHSLPPSPSFVRIRLPIPWED